jgi:hypothetical protein
VGEEAERERKKTGQGGAILGAEARLKAFIGDRELQRNKAPEKAESKGMDGGIFRQNDVEIVAANPHMHTNTNM